MTKKIYSFSPSLFPSFSSPKAFSSEKSAEEIIGGITYKLDSIDTFNEKINDLNESYSNLQQITKTTIDFLMSERRKAGKKFKILYSLYKWKKYRYIWTPKLLRLFWSFIVFTLGVDYALSPFEGKYIKVAALALVWILLEFYFVPKLTKYLDKKQYQSFDKIFKLLYTNKVILLCNIELYEHYQKK